MLCPSTETRDIMVKQMIGETSRFIPEQSVESTLQGKSDRVPGCDADETRYAAMCDLWGIKSGRASLPLEISRVIGREASRELETSKPGETTKKR